MSFISIINHLIKNTVNSTVKFDFIIESLFNKFNNGCPTINELNNIIVQKQNLEKSIVLIQNNINVLNTTKGNIQNIIKVLENTLNVLKSLPLPVSVPPGAGLPTGYIITLADKLGNVKDLVTSNKNLIQTTSQVSSILSDSLSSIKNKIGTLETKILECLTPLLESMSEEEKNTYLSNNFNFDSINLINDLNPNTPLEDSLIYDGFKIEIEYNSKNNFLVPQRRAIAKSLNSNLKIKGEYSFTSNISTLIEEMKYILNSRKN